jgi:hypothetical protein
VVLSCAFCSAAIFVKPMNASLLSVRCSGIFGLCPLLSPARRGPHFVPPFGCAAKWWLVWWSGRACVYSSTLCVATSVCPTTHGTHIVSLSRSSPLASDRTCAVCRVQCSRRVAQLPADSTARQLPGGGAQRRPRHQALAHPTPHQYRYPPRLPPPSLVSLVAVRRLCF